LADDDRNCPGRQRVVDLFLDRSLGFKNVVDGRPIDDIRRKSGITIVDDLQVFEKVDIEILQITTGIANRLLTDALRTGDPLRLGHTGIFAPTGDKRRPDDRHVNAFEIVGPGRMRKRHESRHIGIDHRKVAGAGEDRVSHDIPSGVGHGSISWLPMAR
jgi:hypothetical protein